MPIASIPTNDRKERLIATAGQTVFAYDFPIYAATDLLVIRERVGIETIFTLGVDYTVAGVNEQSGGTITLTTAAQVNDVIVIISNMPSGRASQFVNGGDLPASALEAEFNKIRILIQQFSTDLSRTILFPVNENTPRNLPSVANRRTKFLGFDDNGQLFAGIPEQAIDFGSLDPDTVRQQIGAASSAVENFLYSLTGSISRPLQTKLEDLLSIKDFGAVGNGVVNDAPAIQAAVNALPASGGALYFPAGTYLIASAVTINKPGVFFGDGWATNIRTSSATANSFLVTGAEQVHIEKMRFTSSVIKTAGWYVDVAASANRFRLSDFAMDGAIGGVRTAAAATSTIERGQILNCRPATGIPIRIDQGFDVSIRDILSDQTVDTFAGVYITNAGDVTIEDCNLIHCGQALYLNPGAGQVIASLWANNTFFDTSSRAVYFFAQGGTIVRSLFDQCWFSGSTNEGVRLETSSGGSINGTDFNGCHIFLNLNGVSVIDTGVINTRLHDSVLAQNSANGIFLAAGVSEVSIQDCRIGASHGLTGNGAAGISIAAGAGNNIQILNNDLRGNIGVNLSNSATGANVIVDNNLGANESWTAYTPAITTLSGSITTLGVVAGRYQKIGKQLFISVAIAITTNGTGAGALRATLPAGLVAAADQTLLGRENSITGNQCQGMIFAGTNIISITRYDNAYPGGNGHRILLSGCIEVN